MQPVALPVEPRWRRPLTAELGGVVPASQMPPRPPADCVPTGVTSLDALTGGLPRGTLTEIFGPASSGRTSLLLSILAQATARGEICALVDAADNFDPASAHAAGVDLKRVLWVRCGKSCSSFLVSRQKPLGAPLEKQETRNSFDPGVENALQAADFLLQAGGFGLLVMDLASVPPQTARRVPLTSWFRFRRAVENTPTALLALEEEPFAKSAAGLVLKMSSAVGRRSSAKLLPSHARLLCGTEIAVEVVRAVTEQKLPARAVSFETRAQWAG